MKASVLMRKPWVVLTLCRRIDDRAVFFYNDRHILIICEGSVMINPKNLVGVFVGAFLLSISACKISPPGPEVIIQTRDREITLIDTRTPLTTALIQQLSRPVVDFQLHLFGRITLERHFTQSTPMVDERGRGNLLNEHIRERISVNDQTPGQAIKVEHINGEIILSVSFDDSWNDFLLFSSSEDKPDGFFDLRFDPNENGHLGRDTKGSVDFRGNRYSVNYTGNRPPYLLIQLTQEDRDRLNEQTLGGRLIRPVQQ